MRLLVAFVAIAPAATAAATAATVTVNWVSYPLREGETALVAGGGFEASSRVELTGADGKTLSLNPFDVTESALKFTVPAGAPAAAALSIDGTRPYDLNVPDVWWWQGDQGNASTPAGWLRVFGRSIGLPPAAHAADVDMQRQLMEAASAHDFDRAERILGLLKLNQNLAAQVSATQLRLTPAGAYVCMYACMHACMYMHVRTYVCTYIRTYVRTYACMHVCAQARRHPSS